jgi:hypothetical protein
VYQGTDNTPLLPTLEPLIYANRFRGPAKTLIHLYNATGHTFDGPVLSLTDDDIPDGVGDVHAIELLSGRELPIENGTVSLYIERDDVACVAGLPVVLQIDENAGVAILDGRGGTLVVAAADGTELLVQGVDGDVAAVDAGALPADATPACIKLLRDGQLVDVIEWRI